MGIHDPQRRRSPRTVDGEQIIENWAWHGPTRDSGTFTLREAKTVEIVVEHFEIDGYAVLELGISRTSDDKP